MARRQRESGGGDSWLNTYADMVTLLLTFFAVLLSMSSTDQNKFNAFIESYSYLPQEVIDELVYGVAGSGGSYEVASPSDVTTDMDQLYYALKSYVETNDQTGAVTITKEGEVIYVRFSSFLFFEPDEYVLRSTSLPVLSFIGDGLKQYEDKIRMVNVLGFTATIENGTYWMLSGERSAVVASYLNYDCGFPSDKLTVIGYGNQYPIAPNDSEENRKKNRRVELVIIGSDNNESFDVNDALTQYYNSSKYPTQGTGEEAQLPDNASTSSGSTAAGSTTSGSTADTTSSAGNNNAQTSEG